MNAAAVKHAANKPPAGLYLHIPFCFSKCGYCTFVSRVYDAGLADAYISALQMEMRKRAYFTPNFLPRTIFIGGGTPSCLSLSQLKRLMQIIPQPVTGEATCEINPDSCSEEKLRVLQDYGINRISFGVQTFNPRGLRLLERRHDAETARRAVETAMRMKFRSVNLDLIHGWPGQDEETLIDDMKTAIDLGIQHISNYTLIVDPDASGYATYHALLGGDEIDEEVGGRYWEKIEHFLEEKGFEHYETSNFSRPGHRCRHNVETWRGGEYVGAGLGACSHIGGERSGNITALDEYIRCSLSGGEVTAYRERLEGEAKARECAVFWLRLFDGVEMAAFYDRTGFDFCALYADVLPDLLANGMMETADGRIWVTQAYQPLLDSVLVQLI